MRRTSRIIALLFVALSAAAADGGSGLWLSRGGANNTNITAECTSPTAGIAAGELVNAWRGRPVTLRISPADGLDAEGYRISYAPERIVLSSPTPAGLLYAAYDLLRRQALETVADTGLVEVNPAIPLRILNHWDNLDGTIERGYAGSSLWDWDNLPGTLSDKYTAYARANASIGINGTVLNNVNAAPEILSSEYLAKVKALADIFRPYNIKVYLSVNFASPMVLGGLSTADPADETVARWWADKAREIYSLIPDFGGFTVKANSEGQPGPGDYGRTHAEGANMIASALQPYGGVLLWRAFVYNPSDPDRIKQAYNEFMPLDGQFAPNVIIQAKNGPFDFQPREPYSPLFTAMNGTALAAELQITQEYLGHANHIVFLAPLWREFFSFVAHDRLKAVAGVANTGSNDNWCGNIIAQANWYAFGRMAWSADISPEEIAGEWMLQTFERGKEISRGGALREIMLGSREAAVNYMTPLGLNGLFAWGHHYGPEPWCDMEGVREDWLPRYYHHADTTGIGFDRTPTGSNAIAQYPDSLRLLYGNPDTCPEKYLLWFHHLPWT
ncbi:MAG: alpha-glucuronidase, partial [Prevotella sp.]|nr:alpha-glucuronidase [Prevotella sp.]